MVFVVKQCFEASAIGRCREEYLLAYKILCVDDEKNLVDIYSAGLIKAGYEVVIAYDGEQALEKAEQDKPDVVILDLMMPKLNGFEVLMQIRKRFKKWIPVIIYSAENDLESLKKAYRLEADHYLTKPCSMENMIRGVETMLSLIPLRIQEPGNG
ncbi:MAG: response regulator [Candidatus Omnitrophota bacterium]